MRPLTDEQQKAVAANLNLVRWCYARLAWRPDVRAMGVDEALQVGSLALIKAIKSYSGHLGKLSTYAVPSILGTISLAARRRASWAALQREPPQDVEDTGDPLDAEDRAAEVLRALDPRSRAIARAIFGEGRTLKEVAAEHGISGERVRQIAARARERLRMRFTHLVQI